MLYSEKENKGGHSFSFLENGIINLTKLDKLNTGLIVVLENKISEHIHSPGRIQYQHHTEYL